MGFIPAKLPTNEDLRVRKLYEYQILDTTREVTYDRITNLVIDLLKVPVAAISIVDRDRLWFLSNTGMPKWDTSRCESFCAHTILDSHVLVVPDARDDQRFSLNPLVMGWPGIRFYAGAPLITPDGYRIGALCAIDYVQRDLFETQIEHLETLARLVVNELELRKQTDAVDEEEYSEILGNI